VSARSAPRGMTVDEFLAWDDRTGTRYELVDGQPVAMNPPGGPHRTIAANAARLIGNALARGGGPPQGRRPCRPEAPGSVTVASGRWREPDVAVTCQPPGPTTADPLLLVEVLSPGNRDTDLLEKVPEYKALPSVGEIWLVETKQRWVQVWRRDAAGVWHGTDHAGDAFASPTLEALVPLDEIYAGSEVAP
jgi:Uma2 family endonuclease